MRLRMRDVQIPKNMIKKVFKFILSPFLGRRRFQGLFHFMYKFSLKGMNFGGGADFKNSGERWVLKYAKRRYKSQNPFVLLDVGANQGGYALAANAILKNCAIYCFEPAPKTFVKLQAAAASFSNIQIFNFGLSAQKAQSSLFFSESVSGLASLYDRPVFREKGMNAASVSISLDTVDSFCEKRGITEIDFLKLDVEGHELEVLKGAGEMIKNRRIDYIQFEFGGTDIDARVFLKDFFEFLGSNYQIFRILKDGLQIVEYDETQEIFTTTNYLAQLK